MSRCLIRVRCTCIIWSYVVVCNGARRDLHVLTPSLPTRRSSDLRITTQQQTGLGGHCPQALLAWVTELVVPLLQLFARLDPPLAHLAAGIAYAPLAQRLGIALHVSADCNADLLHRLGIHVLGCSPNLALPDRKRVVWGKIVVVSGELGL